MYRRIGKLFIDYRIKEKFNVDDIPKMSSICMKLKYPFCICSMWAKRSFAWNLCQTFVQMFDLHWVCSLNLGPSEAPYETRCRPWRHCTSVYASFLHFTEKGVTLERVLQVFKGKQKARKTFSIYKRQKGKTRESLGLRQNACS